MAFASRTPARGSRGAAAMAARTMLGNESAADGVAAVAVLRHRGRERTRDTAEFGECSHGRTSDAYITTAGLGVTQR